MNCKQGDLAVVVGGENNCGAIVQCLRLASAEDFKRFGLSMRRECWVTDRQNLITKRWEGVNILAPLAPDEFLRPLRDNEGDDESLSWAGKPEQVAA